MALRSGHGTGSGAPRIEVLPADELPQPVLAAAVAAAGRLHELSQVPLHAELPSERTNGGRFAKGARTAQSRGWHAMRLARAAADEMRHLEDMLGLSKLVGGTSFGPYRTKALEFLVAHLVELKNQVGGDAIGPGPSAMVASAALQMAASRWAFDRGAEQSDAALMKLGSQLANDSRQNLLAAYELAVREAQARRTAPGVARPGWRKKGGT